MLQGTELAKKYGDVYALKNANVEVAPGEALVLLGPNGSGKSTLISLLSMCKKADEGTVNVDGLTGKNARKLLAYVPQEIVLFEELSAIDNMKCFSSLKGAEAVQKIAELTEALSLSGFIKKRVDKLSGGQRRRVNIAVAMMCNPKYLLLDEPFAGVDEESGECLKAYLERIKQTGIGIVISEHDKERVRSFSNRVVTLEKGHILSGCSAEEFYRVAQA